MRGGNAMGVMIVISIILISSHFQFNKSYYYHDSLQIQLFLLLSFLYHSSFGQ
ncbi:MAG: Ca2+/Na+ antiporter [Patescibacteria group bacterium]|jgi:Ca2+/Na+ antiporter